MKKNICLLYILILLSCKENNEYNIDSKELEFASISLYDKEKAISNIANDDIVILFSGSFGGMPNFKNEKDSIFQKKYKVTFYSEGCIRSSSEEDMLMYNETIFNYLDSKFGENWRKEIRNNSIGFF